MEKSLKLYIDNELGERIGFPEGEEQIEISAFTADYKRMGNAPTITCTVKHPNCLDNAWTYGVYTMFNNERFYLKQIPSSSFSNKDARYIHELELCSERVQLDNVFVFDVVSPNVTVDRPVSNNTNFSFFGTIEEFAQRLNYSLVYTKLQEVNTNGEYVSGYRVVIDKGIVSEGKLVTIENKVFSEVLQESFNTFEIPYYFVGKDIHLGYAPNPITEVFQYGAENSLLSIKKENAKTKVINRITGTGSEDNIPYYYPNKTSLGDISIIYNGKENRAVIGDQAKFSKNKLSNVFKYYSYDGFFVNYQTNLEQIDSLTYLWSGSHNGLLGWHDFAVYKIKYKFSFHVDKVHLGTFHFYWSWMCDSILDEEYAPMFKLYHLSGQEQKLAYEWKAETKKNGIFNRFFSKSSTKEFHDLNGDYILEIEHQITTAELRGVSDREYDISNYQNDLILEASYGEPPVYYWLLENKAISSISDYGIKTLVVPKDGDTIELRQDDATWLVPQKKLMPPKYRETFGAERFYNAKNGEYTNPETGGKYTFANVYVEGNPSEHIAEFEEIKPTIVGVTNSNGEPINSFIEFAYDDNDSDEKDEEGKLIHPYFFAKLRKLDGEHGFNLFHHAIESGEMTISMTSGSCGGCQWVIGVDPNNKMNPVQVYEEDVTDEDGTVHLKGSLKRDENGDVLCGRKGELVIQDRQQDTINNEVWIALMKEEQTFHTVMPNETNKYYPSKGDEFVILNIHLPHAYITAAEERLEKELIRYMADNNDEKFKFSIDFSKVYFAEHEDVLAKLNENARLTIKYNNAKMLMYVSSFSYSIKENSVYPDIKVELSEEIEISSNAIQQAVTQVEVQLSNKISNLDIQALGAPYFHRKDISDTTSAIQTFTEGVKIGKDKEYGFSGNGVVTADGFRTKNFEKGFVGASIYKDETGTVAEVDYLNVRKKATFKEVEIQETKHIGGKLELTAAQCKCEAVEQIKDDGGNLTLAYKVYFRRYSGDGELITNKWQIGDQARCDTFNIEQNKDGTQGNRYYWRLVTDVGTGGYALDNKSMAEYHWIVLSNKDYDTIEYDGNTIENTQGFDEGSTYPIEGDSIIQLGNRFGTQGRTSAIELAGAGTDSPCIRQMENITTFSLGDVDTQIKPGDNKFKGIVSIEDGSYGVGNFTDLPEEVHKSVQVGGDNLLRNSGFDGEHQSVEITPSRDISEDSSLYSENFVFWTTNNAVSSVPYNSSRSGFACQLEAVGSSIEQVVTLIENEKYVLSFKCAGSVRVVGLSTEDFTDVVDTVHKIDIIGTGEPQTIKFAAVIAWSLLWEAKLERGTVRTDWTPSQHDTAPVAESFRHLWYLQDALKGKTEILGGLILSSILQLGNYRNGVMEQVTAGVNGITRNPASDVAFWGGGTFEQAIKAVNMFKNNPSYQPTEEEVASIAKAVITHGGRAILNDIVLRGYIYALGGVFNGTVNATGGVFRGDVVAKRTIVTVDPNPEYYSKTEGPIGNQTTTKFLIVKNAYITGNGNYYLPELDEGQMVEIVWFLPQYVKNYYAQHSRFIVEQRRLGEDAVAGVGVLNENKPTVSGPTLAYGFLQDLTITPKSTLYRIIGDRPIGQQKPYTYWTIIEAGSTIKTEGSGIDGTVNPDYDFVYPPDTNDKIPPT